MLIVLSGKSFFNLSRMFCRSRCISCANTDDGHLINMVQFWYFSISSLSSIDIQKLSHMCFFALQMTINAVALSVRLYFHKVGPIMFESLIIFYADFSRFS